jgi:hypothetical protein
MSKRVPRPRASKTGPEAPHLDETAKAAAAIEAALRPFPREMQRKLLRMVAIYFDMDQLDRDLRDAKVR